MSTPAKRLQLAREHAGYKSGRMAALRLGWKYPTYAAHESGWRMYPPGVAKKYARAFNVTEEWLLFGKSPPTWIGPGSDPELSEVETPLRYMALFQGEDADQIQRQLTGGADRRDFCIADLDNLRLDASRYG
jgi:hypothetical protein